jgi:C1A family cysteine protease
MVEGKVSQDTGAAISDGCRSLMQFGVCSEETWPYVETNEPVQPSQDAYDEAKGHVIHTPTQIMNNNIDHLKYSLAENKPFVVGLALYPEIHNTTNTGIVPMPTPGEEPTIHHAVLCVGYNDQDELWIFRNSWGPDWGDQGYVLAFSLYALSHMIE